VTLQVGDTWSTDGTTDNSGSLKTTVGSVNLSSVTNTLAVANGGTGLTSFTANSIVYASSTSALATNSNLVFNGTTTLGLGVTPSSWGGGGYSGKVLEVGAVGNSVWGVNATNLYLMNNVYYNNGFLYASTNKASYYLQQDGSHFWNSAPSGTVGTTITPTQVLAVSKGTTLVLENGTSTSGTGIAFPATQSASSDANTLDDYEEGTWTPTYTAASGTLAGVSTGGRYTKIGRIVHIIAYVTCSGPGTASGLISINNFPFASQQSITSGFYITEWYTGTIPSETYGCVRFENSSTSCNILGFNFNGNGDARLQATGIGGTLAISFSGTYILP
jgi:hypothetical protein